MDATQAIPQLLLAPDALRAAMVWLVGTFFLAAGSVASVTYFLTKRAMSVPSWADMTKAIKEAVSAVSKENARVHDEMADTYQRAQADCVAQNKEHNENTATHLRLTAKDIDVIRVNSDLNSKKLDKICTAMVLTDPTGRVKDIFDR